MDDAGQDHAKREADRGVPFPFDPKDPDQSWFWTEKWQQMKREADEDIAAGRVEHFDDVEAFLAYLDRTENPEQ